MRSQEALTASKASVTRLEGTVAGLEGKVTGLEAKVAAKEASVAAKEASVSALEASVASLEASVAAKEAAVASLEASAASLEASVASLQANVPAADEIRAALAQSVAEIDRLRRDAEAFVGVDPAEYRALKQAAAADATEAAADDPLAELRVRARRLELALAATERERKAAQNELTKIRGNVRVACRVRPLEDKATRPAVIVESADSVAVADRRFRFDRVFNGLATNATVYALVADYVQAALDGSDVCLFTLGQSGSGKTHTMEGTANDPGVWPLAIAHVMRRKAVMELAGLSYAVTATFVQVYGKVVTDVCDPARKVRVTDAGLENALVTVLETDADVARLLRGTQNRRKNATALNAESSRSHAILSLHIEVTGADADASSGSLRLVDLAGAEGDVLKEAAQINTDLSALSKAFAARAAGDRVTYRDNQLTRVLQRSLESGKTLMLVTVKAGEPDVRETLNSLDFADAVSRVRRAPKLRPAKRGHAENDSTQPNKLVKRV